jgi:hypothetical protein
VVNETYLEHMAASSRIGWRLAKASAACFIHAVVPGLHKTTCSSAILKLHDEVYPRRFDQPTF